MVGQDFVPYSHDKGVFAVSSGEKGTTCSCQLPGRRDGAGDMLGDVRAHVDASMYASALEHEFVENKCVRTNILGISLMIGDLGTPACQCWRGR